MKSEYELNKKLDKNRELINSILCSDLQLSDKYEWIRLLSCENERIIKKIKDFYIPKPL